MKKLFLLLAIGISVNAVAQNKEHRAVDASSRHKGAFQMFSKAKVQGPVESNTGKSTDQINGEWWSFSDAIIIPGVSELAYWPIYPDSNIHTGNFNWYLHGIGTSFDPTSNKFQPNFFSNPTPYYPQPTFTISSSEAYAVDSIGIIGWYERINQVTDTLDIYVVATGTPGAYAITWSFTGPVDAYWDRPDSQLQNGSPIYDWQTNSINADSVPNVIKITKILDAAAFGDSTFFAPDNTHLHMWNFALGANGINVAANQVVTAFVAFRSAINHPLGTDWNLANKWQHLTLAVNGGTGIPQQNVDDYNCGLGAFSQDRYHTSGFWDLSNGSTVLAPMYNYTPVYMSDPWFAFHIKKPVSVNDVKGNKAELNAYPNPAKDKITIAFTAEQKGKANVTITNALGQVIDSRSLEVKGASSVSFSTSTLPDGVYFYNVEVNGQRTSTQFVVAH